MLGVKPFQVLIGQGNDRCRIKWVRRVRHGDNKKSNVPCRISSLDVDGRLCDMAVGFSANSGAPARRTSRQSFRVKPLPYGSLEEFHHDDDGATFAARITMSQ
jgi:hypothetical protein